MNEMDKQYAKGQASDAAHDMKNAAKDAAHDVRNNVKDAFHDAKNGAQETHTQNKVADAQYAAAKQTGDTNMAYQAAHNEAAADQKQGGILESVKESLGKAGEAVKEAAIDAKDSAKDAIDNTRARM